MAPSKTIGSEEIHAAIKRLAAAISARHGKATPPLLLGIASGGVELARRLAGALHAKSGTIDVSFHRDDIGRNPIPKEFEPTAIPGDVDGATVILVDDVLFSGRTVKAALDELFDYGRPGKVELAVLIDRGGRLLPISADYVGLTIEPSAQQKVVVTLDAENSKRDTVQLVARTPADRTP